MAKAKPGDFSLKISTGVYDLVSLRNDKTESAVLDELKNDCLRHGNFPEPKPGRICYNSIAAFLIYVQSTSMIAETEKPEDAHWH